MNKKLLVFSLMILISISFVYAYTLKDVLSGRVSLVDVISGKATYPTGCTDSDGGKDYYVKGNVISGTVKAEDYCWSPNAGNISKGPYVIEYFCSVSDEIESDDTAYYCPYGCSDGACINLTIPTNVTCTDSDGGIDLYRKGFIKGYEDGTAFEREDSCTAIPGGKTVLDENYCYTDYEIGNGGILGVTCLKDCKEGKCLGKKRITPLCKDSDGGQDYNLKGYTRGPVFTGKEEDLIKAKTYKDQCRTKDGKIVLAEYFCRDGLVNSISYSCQNGCSNGRCK